MAIVQDSMASKEFEDWVWTVWDFQYEQYEYQPFYNNDLFSLIYFYWSSLNSSYSFVYQFECVRY
jgi:hypothetical protein